MRLNVRGFALDLKHDVGGEKESYELGCVNERIREKWKKERLPVGYIGKRSYLSKSFSRANFALSDIAACLAGSINSARWTGPGLMLCGNSHVDFIRGGTKIFKDPLTIHQQQPSNHDHRRVRHGAKA